MTTVVINRFEAEDATDEERARDIAQRFQSVDTAELEGFILRAIRAAVRAEHAYVAALETEEGRWADAEETAGGTR